MSNLKTSYIPSTFFGGQYFKVGETVSNLHAVDDEVKKNSDHATFDSSQLLLYGLFKAPSLQLIEGVLFKQYLYPTYGRDWPHICIFLF